MVKWVAMVAMALLLLVQGARAQQAADPLVEAVRQNADRVETRLLDLVAGFGGPDGLTAEGIAAHVALERAAARASALRRFHAIDLNADGAVDRDELALARAAASAAARGRMDRLFDLADANGDGRVDAAEIAAAGRAAGFRALGEEDEALLRAALRLDADGDGALTAAEVAAGIARLAEAA
jgi:Ca2+-binding EF-hand superfamily protein